MQKLVQSDLYSLEEYHRERESFRARVLAHKKWRYVQLGPQATLYFEDRLTIQYQVQEMLRVERIFETQAIEEELAAYNPLVPDGSNLVATFMIEIPDADERREALQKMLGIEDRVYAEVAGFDRVFVHADEDLDRSTDEKTSAVHFVRFGFDDAMREALKRGAALTLGVDHPQYEHQLNLPEEVRQALMADLD